MKNNKDKIKMKCFQCCCVWYTENDKLSIATHYGVCTVPIGINSD